MAQLVGDRLIKQIAACALAEGVAGVGYVYLFALAYDGTVWRMSNRGEGVWERLPDLPEAPAEADDEKGDGP